MPKFVPIFSQSSQKTDYFKNLSYASCEDSTSPIKNSLLFDPFFIGLSTSLSQSPAIFCRGHAELRKPLFRILLGVCTQKSAAKAALTAPLRPEVSKKDIYTVSGTLKPAFSMFSLNSSGVIPSSEAPSSIVSIPF